jgi:predicted nuclease of restriction endonuclease-like RecB superfamily
MVEPMKRWKRQQYFEDQRRNLSDRELQLNLLYSQKLLIETMDKLRGNTNTLIWWLIAIPI